MASSSAAQHAPLPRAAAGPPVRLVGQHAAAAPTEVPVVLKLPDLTPAAGGAVRGAAAAGTWMNRIVLGAIVVVAVLIVARLAGGRREAAAPSRAPAPGGPEYRTAQTHHPIPTWKVPTPRGAALQPAAAPATGGRPTGPAGAWGPTDYLPSARPELVLPGAESEPVDRTSPFYVAPEGDQLHLELPATGTDLRSADRRSAGRGASEGLPGEARLEGRLEPLPAGQAEQGELR
jgi:hypothetical protein